MKISPGRLLLSALAVITFMILALPVYLKAVFDENILFVQEYELPSYILFTVTALLIGFNLQKNICGEWRNAVFIFLYSFSVTAFLFLYNNFLRFIAEQYLFKHILGQGFFSVIKQNFEYAGGVITQRYILYFFACSTLLSMSIMLGDGAAKDEISQAIWRIRMNSLFFRLKRNPQILSKVTILDAPSAYGKTLFVKRLIREQDALKIKVKALSSEEFMNAFLRYISTGGTYESDDLPMNELFSDCDAVVIEDIDLMLAGREAVQEQVAHIFIKAVEHGKGVLITGIDIEHKAPFFYCKITRFCEHKCYIA